MSRNHMRPPGGLPPLNGGRIIQAPPPPVQIVVEHTDVPGIIPELASPVTIVTGNKIHIFGGLTKRLALAGSIVCHATASGQDDETACRTALTLADKLIAMERADRFPEKPADAPEEKTS